MTQSDDNAPVQSQELARVNRRTAWKLGGVFVLMFGFSFALIPLYDLLCEVTGLGGNTGVVNAAELDGQVDTSRTVKVQFLATANSRIPWEFAPDQDDQRVNPGQVYAATYTATNTSSSEVVGQAIPKVSPPQASKYFSKTECFCFRNQTLKPGETKVMPIRFVLDRALPDRIKSVTLSYTFFRVDGVKS
ncbi:MAG: cytochrome c oxidase assembly protein [Pseudomonadota bacterium]